MANVSKWYQTVAMEVYLPFNFAIVFSLVYFRCQLPIDAPNCPALLGAICDQRKKSVKYNLKLGTIIILSVHILQNDSVDTGSLPVDDFVKHSPSYFRP